MLEVDKVLSQSCEQSHKNRMLVELSEMESKMASKISGKAHMVLLANVHLIKNKNTTLLALYTLTF